MSLTPTVIPGDPQKRQIVPQVVGSTIGTGAIVLRADQLPQVQQAVTALDFATMPAGDIIKLGLSAEQALHKTLDGFLARLDKRTAAQVFELFRRLEKGVEDANLPEILEQVQHGSKPGPLGSLIGMFRGKSREEVIQDLMGEIGDMIAGRTKTLADEMSGLEAELTVEMKKLYNELQVLDSLKRAYSLHFQDFTVQAAIANAFLVESNAVVASEVSQAQPHDMVAQSRIQELQGKLRLLESRALALEGTYTRLPADHLVIQQIEQAGITTLQETATTVAARFASIKMTLLAIHGAFAVANVQRISDSQARLDQQLTSVRAKALRQVATKAASAPGENRLQQAQQVAQIIQVTKEIHELIEQANLKTDENFEVARQTFAQARQDLAALSTVR